MAKGTKAVILTTRGIGAMKPGEWAADPAARGAGRLQVRKLASGEVAWYYRYTGPDGARVRLPLGSSLSLADARERSSELSRRYQAGERDLRGAMEAEQREVERERREAKAIAAAERARSNATLGLLLTAYADHLEAACKPSHREVRRAIERNIAEPFPDIAALRADQVTVDDVMPVFHALAKAGKLREAEKLRSYLRAAYTAARRARHDAAMHAFAGFSIATNPLLDLEVTRPKEAADRAAQAAKERKWALSEDQLRAYWKRICALPDPDGALLRLHLLTGGRRVEQMARLTKADRDADRGTVTLRDTKGRRKYAHDHVIPLIPDAAAALEAVQGNGDYLFTVTEGRMPAGYHVVWERVHAVAQEMLEAEEVERLFTPGMIRKTVESRLQAAGVSREVRGYLLSHGLGGVQARHYEVHEFNDEKREALKTLRDLLDPKKGGVVAFRKKSGSRR